MEGRDTAGTEEVLEKETRKSFGIMVVKKSLTLKKKTWEKLLHMDMGPRPCGGNKPGGQEGPSELPERRSSSSAPRRDSAEPRPRGCSGLGEPRPALPSF